MLLTRLPFGILTLHRPLEHRHKLDDKSHLLNFFYIVALINAIENRQQRRDNLVEFQDDNAENNLDILNIINFFHQTN